MNKKQLVIVTTAILALGGVGATVAAQRASQEASITGTIQIPSGTQRISEVASLATVTEPAAIAAAQAALGVTTAPTDVELEVENGFLVWEVEFPGKEVVVDAGSAEVLLIEAEEDEGLIDDDAFEDEGLEVEDDDQ